MKIAIVEAYPSSVDYSSLFNFPFELFALTESKRKKLLKKDILLENEELDKYDRIITVGAEVCRFVGKFTGVSNLQGHLIEDRFLPLTNPAIYAIKPAAKPMFDKAVERINEIIRGNETVGNVKVEGLQDANLIHKYLDSINNAHYLAVDTETTSLYPRKGHVLGICLSANKDHGVYIDSDYIDDEVASRLQRLFNKTTCIFHNAKFDITMLEEEGLSIPKSICTLRLARYLDENAEVPEFGLQFLRYYYELEVSEANAHDAEGDVLVLEEVFKILRDKLKVKMETDDEGELINEMI